MSDLGDANYDGGEGVRKRTKRTEEKLKKKEGLQKKKESER